ncbi:oxysterol-binding protein-related protein 8-like isoform X2 [Oscarella lobularis]|uniref:oxysterol-binding protein-related protein 8-like isoform X2 n=1 Tax=Oscarella lobularis TaxID=121494 RepID=UPI003313E277
MSTPSNDDPNEPSDGDAKTKSSQSYPTISVAHESAESKSSSVRKMSDRSRSNATDSPAASKPGGSAKKSDKESYKQMKENYRREVKKVHRDAKETFSNPTVVVMSGWLKIRGSLKIWAKLWCVVKPGLLLIYKNEKQEVWGGTLLLSALEVIERPSKKEGFCFKIFHPIEQSIWAAKGPKGELTSGVVHPMPKHYLILRAASEAEGRCWLDALEVALRMSLTSGLHCPPSSSNVTSTEPSPDTSPRRSQSSLVAAKQQKDLDWNEHSFIYDEIVTRDEREPQEGDFFSGQEDKFSSDDDDSPGRSSEVPKDTEPEAKYVSCTNDDLGEATLTGEWEASNKSLLWMILKQVRPGMDLSKVVLPTFILEPRSFLDKLSDYHYHANLLSKAASTSDALERMKAVVCWFLSGFYKKPKGLKKPYNPIIGETFRCMWHHPETNSKTFFVAEQLSHHPPVSGFYASNRKDGFCIDGCIVCKSKFYGNSTQILLNGKATVTFLDKGEEYTLNYPYVNCKGLLIPPITVELGGHVVIDCEKTGYRTEMDFKLKPFWKSNDHLNALSGKIKVGKETVFLLDGHWDGEVWLTEKQSPGAKSLLWNPDSSVRSGRLKRHVIDLPEQGDFESERLWKNVTEAIINEDQTRATEEKAVLEDRQRKEEKERKTSRVEWVPNLFEKDSDGEWVYIHRNVRPWDARNDVYEYDVNGVIKTRTQRTIVPLRAPSVHNLFLTKTKQRTSTSTPTAGAENKVLSTLPVTSTNGDAVAELKSSVDRLVVAEKENREKLSQILMEIKARRGGESSRGALGSYTWLVVAVMAIAYAMAAWLPAW